MGEIFFHRAWGGGPLLRQDYVSRKDDMGQAKAPGMFLIILFIVRHRAIYMWHLEP
jgi:hypothetical protein